MKNFELQEKSEIKKNPKNFLNIYKNYSIFRFHKSPILIDDIDINKTIVFNKVSLGKNILNILLFTKIIKRLSHYP